MKRRIYSQAEIDARRAAIARGLATRRANAEAKRKAEARAKSPQAKWHEKIMPTLPLREIKD